MLDFDLSKMALISVVALVVLGPERLPRVARTAGALFSRAQRYVNDVKADVSRELELDALRSIKSDVEQAARKIESTAQDRERMLHDAVHAQVDALNQDLHVGQVSAASAPVSAGSLFPQGPAQGIGHACRDASAISSKRRHWRTRKGTPPLWYKRANVQRAHVQSGAARMARHRSVNFS